MNQLVTPVNADIARLSDSISSVATSIAVNDTTGFTSTGFLVLEAAGRREVVEYAGISGNTFTSVTRGQEGTLAQSFQIGSTATQLQWMPVIAEADTVATTTDVAGRNATIQYQNDGINVSTKGAIQYVNFTDAGVTVTSPSAGNLEVAIPLQNLFQSILVSGSPDVVAESPTDSLTLIAGANMTITADAGADSITFAATGGSGLTQPQVMARTLGC